MAETICPALSSESVAAAYFHRVSIFMKHYTVRSFLQATALSIFIHSLVSTERPQSHVNCRSIYCAYCD